MVVVGLVEEVDGVDSKPYYPTHYDLYDSDLKCQTEEAKFVFLCTSELSSILTISTTLLLYSSNAETTVSKLASMRRMK